jgi:hypothetical protein
MDKIRFGFMSKWCIGGLRWSENVKASSGGLMLGFKKETLKKSCHFQPTNLQLLVTNYHLQLYWGECLNSSVHKKLSESENFQYLPNFDASCSIFENIFWLKIAIGHVHD